MRLCLASFFCLSQEFVRFGSTRFRWSNRGIRISMAESVSECGRNEFPIYSIVAVGSAKYDDFSRNHVPDRIIAKFSSKINWKINSRLVLFHFSCELSLIIPFYHCILVFTATAFSVPELAVQRSFRNFRSTNVERGWLVERMPNRKCSQRRVMFTC